MKKLKPFAKGTESGNYYNYFRDAQDHRSETPGLPSSIMIVAPLLEPVSRYFKLCLCSDRQQVFCHCEYVSSLPLSSSLTRLNGSPFDSDFGSL
jgi:hypothetical protein